jgi:hypothetical protein
MTDAPLQRPVLPCPDIRGGRIVNGGEGGNRWVTEIQSVLVAETAGKPAGTAYLGHECRFESLAFGDDPPAPGDTLIKRHQPYQFLTFAISGQFFQVPHPDSLFGDAAFQGLPRLDVDGGFVVRPHSKAGWVAEVACPWVAGEEVPADTLLADEAPFRDLFVRARFGQGDTTWTLFAPCRYLNFSGPGWPGRPYLQPITGHVLFPYADFFLAGYLVAGMAGDEVRMELVAPRYRPAFETMKGVLGPGTGETALLDRLAGLFRAHVPVYDLVLPVTGELSFYRQKG